MNENFNIYQQETTIISKLNQQERSGEKEKKILASLDIGVVIHALDTSIIYSNPRAAIILGLTQDQMNGKQAISNDWKFLREDHTPLPLAEYPVIQVKAGKKLITNMSLGILRPNTFDVRWVVANGIPVFDNQGEIFEIIISFIDITEKKNAENLLKEAEWKFKALFEKGPIGVAYHQMIYDSSGKPIDYRFIDANQTYIELTTVDPRGKTVLEAFPGIEKDPFDWIGQFGEVAKTGKQIRFEQHLRFNDRWYDVVAYQYRPDHFVAAFLNITDRKKIENELVEQKKFSEFIINSGLVMWYIYDLAQKKNIYSNDGIEKILGFSIQDIAKMGNQVVKQLMHPDDFLKYLRDIIPKYSQAKDNEQIIYEYRIKNIKGEWVWIHCVETIYLRDLNGFPSQIFGVGYEISEIKLLNEKLIQAKEFAESANLAKSLFLANMSHELRTPLNGVLGFSSLLEMEDLAPKHKKFVSYIFQSAKNLLELINDILDLSKAEAEKIELNHSALDIKLMVEEIISAQNLLALEKNIFLEKNISADFDKTYLGDALRLKQILNNLVSNAVKFTHMGGVLISVNLISKNNKPNVVQFMVSDTGIGMKPETLEIIFQPFSQGDNSITRQYGGTGLGLVICKKLVELMGGKIEVSSVFEKGSTFSFEIPLLESTKTITSTEKIKNFPKNSPFKNLKVLLIEDHPTNLQLGIEILENLGCKVKALERATAALSLLETEKFDLLLVDIQMPGMSGVEMIKLIRAKEASSLNHQRAIALTAHALEGDRPVYLRAGFDGYVPKPMELDILISEMERILF